MRDTEYQNIWYQRKVHWDNIGIYIYIYIKLGNFIDPANVKYWDGFGICLGKLVKAMKMNHTKVLVAKNIKVYLLLRMHKGLQC